MKRKTRLLNAIASALLVLLLVAGMAMAQAGLIVDNFSDIQVLTLPCGVWGCTGYTWSSVTSVGTDILGTERDVEITLLDGLGLGYLSIYIGVGTDIFSHGQDPGIKGWTRVQWDGVDGSMTRAYDLNADLTDSGTKDGFVFKVDSDDLPVNVTIDVYTTDATNHSQYVLALPGGIGVTPVYYFVPFTAFTSVLGTVLWTDVDAIEMYVDGSLVAVDITLDFVETSSRDFGDLPDPNFPTLLATNGPRHIIGDLYLGALIDGEVEGLQSATALGDDLNNLDDEDGVTRTSGQSWQPGQVVNLNVTVAGGSGYFFGWFDWDNSGTFGAGEMTDFGAVSAGLNVLPQTVPAGYGGTRLFARFRLYETDPASPEPTGEVYNGEVEDYYWEYPTAVTLSSATARADLSSMPLVPVAVVGLAIAGVLGCVGVAWRRRA